MAQVVARINKKTGELEIEVNGIKGTSCKDITQFITENMEVLEEEDKVEMWESSELPDFIENM